MESAQSRVFEDENMLSEILRACTPVLEEIERRFGTDAPFQRGVLCTQFEAAFAWRSVNKLARSILDSVLHRVLQSVHRCMATYTHELERWDERKVCNPLRISEVNADLALLEVGVGAVLRNWVKVIFFDDGPNSPLSIRDMLKNAPEKPPKTIPALYSLLRGNCAVCGTFCKHLDSTTTQLTSSTHTWGFAKRSTQLHFTSSLHLVSICVHKMQSDLWGRKNPRIEVCLQDSEHVSDAELQAIDLFRELKNTPLYEDAVARVFRHKRSTRSKNGSVVEESGNGYRSNDLDFMMLLPLYNVVLKGHDRMDASIASLFGLSNDDIHRHLRVQRERCVTPWMRAHYAERFRSERLEINSEDE